MGWRRARPEVNVEVNRAWALVASLLLLLSGAAPAARESLGVVVLREPASGPGAESGLREGDFVSAWRYEGRPKGGGRLTDAFAWGVYLEERDPGRIAELRGHRGGRRWKWRLPQGPLGITAGPMLDPTSEKDLQKALASSDSGRHAEASAILEHAGGRETSEFRPAAAVWLYLRGAEEAAAARDAPTQDRLLTLAEASAPEGEARFAVLRAKALALSGRDDPGAAALLRKSCEEVRALRGHCRGEVTLLGELGKHLSRVGDFEGARQTLDEGLDLARRLEPGGGLEGLITYDLALLAWVRKDIPRTRDLNAAALGLLTRADPEGRDTFHALVLQGLAEMELGHLDASGDLFERALAFGRRRGYPLDSAIANLSLIRLQQGELGQAEALARHAIALHGAAAAENLKTAALCNILGAVLLQRGDYAEAETSWDRCFSIRERISPGSPEALGSLMNLGVLAKERGNLDRAEELFVRAAGQARSSAPGSLFLAQCLQNLSGVYFAGGLPAEGLSALRESNRIFEAIAPDSLDAMSGNLAMAFELAERGESDEARRTAEETLGRLRTHSGAGGEVVDALLLLGSIEARAGDAGKAEEHYEEALGVAERLSTWGSETQEARLALGALLAGKGRLEEAEVHLTVALEVLSTRNPGSVRYARALREVGLLRERQGRRTEAISLLCESLEVVEGAWGPKGLPGERRAEAAGAARGFYQDYIELLAQGGRAEEAFGVMERSKARGLLTMLSERELTFEGDLPPALDRDRRLAEAALERALQALASAGEEEEAEARTAVEEARRRRREIAGAVRRANPRLASLQQPEPLDVAGAKSLLGPENLLLAWSVGDERTVLFVVGPGGEFTEAYVLPRGVREVGLVVRRFREELVSGGDAWAPARTLARDLLGPAAGRIRRAKGLLLCPDGPLNLLPFAALADPVTTPGRRRRLGETHTLSLISSASTAFELARSGHARPENGSVAFADPSYPRPPDGDLPGGVASAWKVAARRKVDLTPLPGGREEARVLQDLLPSTEVYMGGEATEESVRALRGPLRVLYFACHGWADPERPLESSLCLTVPGLGEDRRHDGLLQAWEILESVRVRTDVAVLSACETGLGASLLGEGMVGLTRAFQYAGAKSVVASLWSVPDGATARLMTRFIEEFSRGASPAEALSAAQTHVLSEGGRASAPYYWAGFQVYGLP